MLLTPNKKEAGSGALGFLQMEENVLKFHMTGKLRWYSLAFHVEQHIYKRKNGGAYIIDVEGLGESCC